MTFNISVDKMIELRSDTATRPTQQMLETIAHASFRDAFLDIDPSTAALEKRCAELFGFEEALFTVSGTMSNQLAVKVHTSPGDEVLIDQSYHINHYEAAAVATISNAHLNTVNASYGIIEPSIINEVLIKRNKSIYGSKITLLCLESSINYHCGKIFPFVKLKEISHFAQSYGWKVHLDGARILNALAEEQIPLSALSPFLDSMMLSLSKGLGAPFGSILLGSGEFIRQARVYNKWLGGGMHQSGMFAEMGLYAINNNIARIKEDNANAKLLASLIKEANIRDLEIPQVETNIVMLDLTQLNIPAKNLISQLEVQGIKLYEWTEYVARAVTSLNVTEASIRASARQIIATLKNLF